MACHLGKCAVTSLDKARPCFRPDFLPNLVFFYLSIFGSFPDSDFLENAGDSINLATFNSRANEVLICFS